MCARLDAGKRPRVVVALQTRVAGRSLASTHALVASAQRRVLARTGRGFVLGRRFRAVPALAGRVDRRALRLLRTSPDVAAVALDHRVHASLAQSVPLLRADDVHARGYTGAGVTVAVLDSGIDSDQPTLMGDIAGQACFVVHVDGTGGCPGGARTATGAGSAEDDEGHGTAGLGDHHRATGRRAGS